MNRILYALRTSILTGTLIATTSAETDDYRMVLIPKENKDERIALLAETHRIKGSSQEVNKQGPVEFPFLSIYRGKENNPFANFTEYRPKLDRFYARQGQFFIENPDKVRPQIPGFPDLDGGIHGHSGTYHKNGMSTEVRDLMDQGHVIQYIDGHGLSYGLYLDAEKETMLIYDAAKAAPRQLFKNAVVDYNNYRMSTARAATVVGDSRFAFESKEIGWGDQDFHFNGHYRVGTEAIFSYRVADSPLLENFELHSDPTPWISQHFLAVEGNEELTYSLGKIANGILKDDGGLRRLVWKDGEHARLLAVSERVVLSADGNITLEMQKRACGFWLAHWAGQESQLGAVESAIRAQAKQLDAVSVGLRSKTRGRPS